MNDSSPSILFEDEHIFVAYKPCGLHSVQIEGGGSSLADWLYGMYPSLIDVAEKSGDAGLVQRLDFDTSGALLGAKSHSVWKTLRDAVQAGNVEKEYVALVEGALLTPQKLASYIGSPYRGGKKVRVYEKEPPRGVRALFGETLLTPILTNNLHHTLVSIYASPARRHQVRAHSAHLGYPLVGDSLYGAKGSFEAVYQITRSFFLHANMIRFLHPISKQTINVTADYQAPQPRP